MRQIGIILAILACLGACGPAPTDQAVAPLALTSSAFEEGGTIPTRYTCSGEDLSPPLAWGDPPAGTQSLALICDDPDAPLGIWVHWVAFNLPAASRSLPEGVPAGEAIAGGGVQGSNSWKRLGYGGPCPPPGNPHRYVFRLYALDTVLGLPAGADKGNLLKAMEGHLLAEGQWVGYYGR